MALFFKNYSLASFTYLMIKFKNAKSFLGYMALETVSKDDV